MRAESKPVEALQGFYDLAEKFDRMSAHDQAGSLTRMIAKSEDEKEKRFFKGLQTRFRRGVLSKKHKALVMIALMDGRLN